MGQSQQYALTVTLLPKLYTYSAEDQIIKLAEEIYRIQEKSSISVSLISELTENFNVHAHGYVIVNISVTNPIKHIYDAFRGSKVIGFIKVKPLTDWNGWYGYCVKERNETEFILHRDPQITDQLEVFRHKSIIDDVEGVGGAHAPVSDGSFVEDQHVASVRSEVESGTKRKSNTKVRHRC